MAAGPPDGGYLVECEFTAGVWTNITSWVDWSAGVTSKFGRDGVYSPSQPSSLTLTLDNTDGRFSPKRQTLADGVTTHPYWPNVVPRKRLRLSYIHGGITYRIGTGRVRGWPTGTKDGYRPRVTLEALGWSAAGARVTLEAALYGEVIRDLPVFYWPLTEDSDATYAAEVVTADSRNALAVDQDVDDGALVFGSSGISEGTSVDFNPTILVSGVQGKGQILLGTPRNGPDPSDQFSLEVWFNAGRVIPNWVGAYICGVVSSTLTDGQLGLDGNGFISWQYFNSDFSGLETITGSANLYDGLWHQAIVRRTATTTELYRDGLLVGSVARSVAKDGGRARWVMVGDAAGASASGGVIYTKERFTGRIAHLAMWNRALTTAEIAAHKVAGRGGKGETPDQRIARWLTAAGLTSSDWLLDVGSTTLDNYPQAGKDVVSASQDMVETEGGGAAFYDAPDGTVRFVNRYTGASALTPDLVLDAVGDLKGDSFATTYDDASLLTRVTGERYTVLGTRASFVVDSGSTDVLTDTTKSNSQSDYDARALAELKLARNRTAAPRVGQLVVDLWTAESSGLYAAIGTLELSAVIELRNVSPAVAPTSYIDLTAQGVTHQISDTEHLVTIDTDAADNPPPTVWGGTGKDSRWQADGQSLNAALTSSATTVVIKTTAGKPVFTTASGAYPMDIQVDAEIITLNTPPGGSTSPQSFTGVTRGVTKRGAGGPAAAHASAAVVQLFPASTWTI